MFSKTHIESWKVINIVVDPEESYLRMFEEQAPRGRTIGNIYTSCQMRIPEMMARFNPSEANLPLNCQVLELEEVEAIATGDPIMAKSLTDKGIIHLSKWLGMGLPIEDKTFKTYNHFPVVYLYWRVSHVVIPSE
jgi:hypothetical protein